MIYNDAFGALRQKALRERAKVMIILKILFIILVLIGVTFVYDARILSGNWFGFGDQNEATSGLKILGFLFAIIGGIILYNII